MVEDCCAGLKEDVNHTSMWSIARRLKNMNTSMSSGRWTQSSRWERRFETFCGKRCPRTPEAYAGKFLASLGVRKRDKRPTQQTVSGLEKLESPFPLYRSNIHDDSR